jgi:hypothetical protein
MMTDTTPSPLTEVQQMSMLWQANQIIARGSIGSRRLLADRVILRGVHHGCTVGVRALAESLRKRHGIVAPGFSWSEGGAA